MIDSVSRQSMSMLIAGKRVLVVDDDDDLREIVRLVLRSCGTQVVAVATAEEALGVLVAVPIDLLISDIAMPDRDGYALIAEVRARTEIGTLPAIALTSNTRDEDRELALRCGFDVHLGKPVEASALLSEVARLVGSSG